MKGVVLEQLLENCSTWEGPMARTNIMNSDGSPPFPIASAAQGEEIEELE